MLIFNKFPSTEKAEAFIAACEGKGRRAWLAIQYHSYLVTPSTFFTMTKAIRDQNLTLTVDSPEVLDVFSFPLDGPIVCVGTTRRCFGRRAGLPLGTTLRRRVFRNVSLSRGVLRGDVPRTLDVEA